MSRPGSRSSTALLRPRESYSPHPRAGAARATQAPNSSILESFARAAVVEHDRLARHRMRVMERDSVRRGPEARLRIHQFVGADRILRVEGLGHGLLVDRRLLPPFREAAVPEGVVAQRLDLPHAALANVLVLVNATLPPGALPPLGRLVQTCLHQRAAAYLGRATVPGDVDDHLHLRMIEQPAVARAVVSLGEAFLEAPDVQAAHARLALVDPAEKPHLAVVGKQVDDLVVLRLVHEVAVRVLQAADVVNVLLDRQLVLELLDTGRECGNVVHVLSSARTLRGVSVAPASTGRRWAPVATYLYVLPTK